MIPTPPPWKKTTPILPTPPFLWEKSEPPPYFENLKNSTPPICEDVKRDLRSVFLKNILLWNSLSLMYISVSENEICIMDGAYSNLIDVCLIFDLFRNFILSFWLPIWLIWETNLLFHQPGFSHLITLSTKIILEMQKNFIDLLFF